MLKKGGLLFFFFLLFMVITACTSLSAPQAGNRGSSGGSAETTGAFFLSVPAQNGLVFIGVAGRRSSSKETLQFALEDAARRVAAFYSVTGEYAVTNNIGSGAFDYIHNTHAAVVYDREGALQYVDSLQYNADTDTIETDNAFFIRTVYPSALPVPVRYRPTYSGANKKPSWIDNLPLEIEGYEVVVGFSGRHASMATTCTNSFNNAILSVIRNINSAVRSSTLLYHDTGSLFGYKTSNDNQIYSYGTLTGFYVLDTWIDPKEKTVWTLAIAQKSE